MCSILYHPSSTRFLHSSLVPQQFFHHFGIGICPVGRWPRWPRRQVQAETANPGRDGRRVHDFVQKTSSFSCVIVHSDQSSNFNTMPRGRNPGMSCRECPAGNVASGNKLLHFANSLHIYDVDLPNLKMVIFHNYVWIWPSKSPVGWGIDMSLYGNDIVLSNSNCELSHYLGDLER